MSEAKISDLEALSWLNENVVSIKVGRRLPNGEILPTGHFNSYGNILTTAKKTMQFLEKSKTEMVVKEK